jgi:hypothetical protein
MLPPPSALKSLQSSQNEELYITNMDIVRPKSFIFNVSKNDVKAFVTKHEER